MYKTLRPATAKQPTYGGRSTNRRKKPIQQLQGPGTRPGYPICFATNSYQGPPSIASHAYRS